MFNKQALVRNGSVYVRACVPFFVPPNRLSIVINHHHHHRHLPVHPKPDSGGSIRPDSLAQLLGYGNAHAGCTAMVVDGFCGLVLGAVLERMGGAFLLPCVVCVAWYDTTPLVAQSLSRHPTT